MSHELMALYHVPRPPPPPPQKITHGAVPHSSSPSLKKKNHNLTRKAHGAVPRPSSCPFKIQRTSIPFAVGREASGSGTVRGQRSRCVRKGGAGGGGGGRASTALGAGRRGREAVNLYCNGREGVNLYSNAVVRPPWLALFRVWGLGFGV
jgi:hypothetical protein